MQASDKARDSRVEQIDRTVIAVLQELSGSDLEQSSRQATFLELGLDSLLLTQAAQALSKRFSVKLKLRHLDEHGTREKLAAYLDTLLPKDAFRTPSTETAAAPRPAIPQNGLALAPEPRALAVSDSTEGVSGGIAQLLQKQLLVMAKQLELLQRSQTAQVESSAQAPASNEAVGTLQQEDGSGASPPEAAPNAEPAPRAHGPQLVLRSTGANLTPTQKRHVARLIERCDARLGGSKAFTAKNRVHVADPRSVAGFSPTLKELVYPIVVARSSGCKLWDVDGNEYVDLLNGFGSNFFGFGAPFVRDAIAKQMEVGMEIGPQTVLVEEVSELFRRLVPAERIAFCNTGSEAVLATLRLARTATGRDLVVIFSGAYHGMFDEVLVRDARGKSLPASPGIPRAAVDNILVLPWADPKSLDTIRERAEDIAAVLVEPVQSRAPEVQPKDFLVALRSLTKELGAALVFDEVVCGFRVAPGGGQEYFGIEADMATYGKVVGGGLSIGIVAGKAEFMDGLDGGYFRYGDDSGPTAGVTYFAGTFVRHPLCLAAAKASLEHLIAKGPELQRSVNERTARFANALNALCEREEAPYRVHHFCSIMKIDYDHSLPHLDLLFTHLRLRGVHVWDGRPVFLTEAHTDEDLDKVLAAFEDALHDLQEGGFLPQPARTSPMEPPAPGAKLGRDPSGQPTWYVPDPEAPNGYRAYQRA